jgi:hypothetical protein
MKMKNAEKEMQRSSVRVYKVVSRDMVRDEELLRRYIIDGKEPLRI